MNSERLKIYKSKSFNNIREIFGVHSVSYLYTVEDAHVWKSRIIMEMRRIMRCNTKY